jgi:hypothetical protein
VEKVGSVKAEKSNKKLSLYGLGPKGLSVAILHPPNPRLERNALTAYSKRLSEAWRVFSELYHLDAENSRSLERWISSADGARSILQYFGDEVASYDESQILLGFRRMIDLAIGLELSGAARKSWYPALWGYVDLGLSPPLEIESFTIALTRLAAIAYQHPQLRKVYNALKKADRPLRERISKHETQIRDEIQKSEIQVKIKGDVKTFPLRKIRIRTWKDAVKEWKQTYG